MLPNFAPSNLSHWFSGAEPFIVVSGGTIVATGSLRGDEIQTVFVVPDMHGMGFGKILMSYLEDIAKTRGITELSLRSSLTSKAFYESLQWQVKGDTFGAVGGQMVHMTKRL